MSEPRRRAETPPTACPTDAEIPDSLEIAGWISTGDPDLELKPARTVGQVKIVIRPHCLANLVYPEYGEDHKWPPAVFAGKDGHMYVADLDAGVRPATSDEVREAVAEELISVNASASARVKTLLGLLYPPVA